MPDANSLQVLVGAGTTTIGSYLAYKLGTKKQAAQMLAVEVDKDESAVEGWAKLAAEHQREFARLGQDLADLRDEVNGLRTKVTELERERDQHRFWRLVGVDYIKALLAVLREHDITPPPQPVGLNLDR